MNYNNNLIIYSDAIYLIMYLPGIELMRLYIFRVLNKKSPFEPDRNHLHHYFQRDDLTVGFHIEESILARRYFGYGLDGEAFDRENIVFARIENRIKQITSDPIIIVHMAADVSVIEERMASLRNTPEHTNSPLLKDDIGIVLKDYEHYVNKSDIGPKVQVDTSIDTPEQTLEKIVDLIKPFISHEDMKKN